MPLDLSSPELSMSVQQLYERDVNAGVIQFDLSQQPLLEILGQLNLALQRAGEQLIHPSVSSKIVSWLHKSNIYPYYPPVQGAYIWGTVGRGKTYLMDLFFEAVPLAKKRRCHFHHFMQEIHAALAEQQGHANPLERVADNLAQQVRLLCFDEMFVQDIADAMILGGLFQAILKRGICLVITSNIACEHLYENGLQRVRFLPAIAVMQTHLKQIQFGQGCDHRLRHLQQASLYHYPIDYAGQQLLQRTFTQLNGSTVQEGNTYTLMQREVPVVAVGHEVIWFTFAALCQTARSVADYIELSRDFHTVIVEGIPILRAEEDEAAHRWVHLVDAFYDRRVKLIVLAQVGINELYQGQQLRFEFNRTRSRLIEMQSEDYLALAHHLK